ncbi:MAG: alpha/beta hydrolase fold domain-containing protein [Alphaproteobacteria bacterium]|nr:alpha/beta hydrolase fold domain-containing protein [Alphaproteobacteria bacterium]
MTSQAGAADVLVVGAGMAGLYAVHALRSRGFSVIGLEAAEGVGGTWFWNRYPGARCDIESFDYCYSFDPDLETEWAWSERYATQPEILRYLNFVADRYDLRRTFRFSTRLLTAAWDDGARVWKVETSAGDTLVCRHLIMATGCLSAPKTPDIPGVERFAGEAYFTSSWPVEGVRLRGKRVAVVGTGSSAVQSIPSLAAEAEHLTVFQRTPAYSIPAHNGPPSEAKRARIASDRAAYRQEARLSPAGVPVERSLVGALQVDASERERVYDRMWNSGDLLGIGGAFADILRDRAANDTLCDYLRGQIRSIVTNPETARALSSQDYPIATKRPCLDTGYYETFNQPNVRLVDLRRTPIVSFTETGAQLAHEHLEFDVVVYATGFDAMTGAVLAVDVRGRGGARLADAWREGPQTYLGLMTCGFPNFFMITGPGSPSVLSNMAVSIEQHVEWITATLADLKKDRLDVIEPTETAQAGWAKHSAECVELSLFREANSWYTGANVSGKPVGVLPYVGGVDVYRLTCDEVRERGYLGFRRSGRDGEKVSDGVVRQLKPDVEAVLRMTAQLNPPPLESLSAEQARALIRTSYAQRPIGPEVHIEDGVFPGAAGDLRFRLYRPPGSGPFPVTLYFHGGGFVLGDHASDDPLCRYLCLNSGSIIVSADYRHAPEHPYPAAHEDAEAALTWVFDTKSSLGGRSGGIVVAGWSAGANLASCVAGLAHVDAPEGVLGQVLLTPVTDVDMSRSSYLENAHGYGLTASLMAWFLDQYISVSERPGSQIVLGAKARPSSPPAVILTAQFDPLRDEGMEFAACLERAGAAVELRLAAGQTHASITMVDLIMSAEPHRRALADAIARFHRT